MNGRTVEARRLRVYMTESARHDGQPLFEWLVSTAARLGMAGATATKALAGFGHHRRLHHAHLLDISDELPIVVEIIDEGDRIETFLEAADPALCGHTYTCEAVQMHRPG